MIQADFELEADVKRTAEETIQKFNQIDVLVNNAGVFASHTVETVTLECFDKIFAVNVRAPLQLTQLLAPHLIKVNELAPHGVRVNAVNPGVIATPLFKRSFGMTDEATAQFLEGNEEDSMPAKDRLPLDEVSPDVLAFSLHPTTHLFTNREKPLASEATSVEL
eukprot:XP_011670238.1 PREDICTED: L-xylulose reductase-like [Strongylocentrotus purpuratus]